MKIAHFILAHKSPEQIELLIKALDHPDFYFFIHLDKKKDITPFKYLEDNVKVFFIKNRVKFYRADFSGIQATLNGFEEINKMNFDYINLISGQDFPIKSAEYIYNYIKQREGTEFVSCESVATEWTESIPRIYNYHFQHWQFRGKYKIGMLLTKLLPRRKFPLNYEVVGRSQWLTITGKAVSYILDFVKREPSVPRYFKYCWGADEYIFATILFNSHFKEKIANNLVYVDWEGSTDSHPKTLTTEDYLKLEKSPMLFARKFDIDKDKKIISKVLNLIGLITNY